MVASAKAVRDYTADDLSPLLQQNPRHKVKFLAETVPFYAATTTFNRLRKSYPEFAYKEATLNPTNPEDRATDWEADVIRDLRDHPDQHEVVGERETPTGRSLFLAHPIKTDASCLECHSIPSAAPHAMVATYGTANGFGWKLNKSGGCPDRFCTHVSAGGDRQKGFSQSHGDSRAHPSGLPFSRSMQRFTGL